MKDSAQNQQLSTWTFYSISQAPNTLSKLQYFQVAIYPDL